MNLLLNEFPCITMNNGIVICNFTSFHDYWLRSDEKDTIGEILPGCTKEVADKYKLKSFENTDIFFKQATASTGTTVWVDIELEHTIPSGVINRLADLHRYNDGEIDIILLPYLLMDLLKQHHGPNAGGFNKIRVCKKIDVRDVTQGIFNSRFCK